MGLIFSVSSVAVLFSSLIQHGMVGTKNWAVPSVVAGVRIGSVDFTALVIDIDDTISQLLFIGITGLTFLSRKEVSAKKPYRRKRVEVIHKVQIV